MAAVWEGGHVRTAPGSKQLALTSAAPAGSISKRGFLRDSTDRVCAVAGGTPATVHNGFAFDSAGLLCVSVDGTVASIHSGYGFDAAGRLVVTATGPFITHNGLEFDAARRLNATVSL